MLNPTDKSLESESEGENEKNHFVWVAYNIAASNEYFVW